MRGALNPVGRARAVPGLVREDRGALPRVGDREGRPRMQPARAAHALRRLQLRARCSQTLKAYIFLGDLASALLYPALPCPGIAIPPGLALLLVNSQPTKHCAT